MDELKLIPVCAADADAIAEYVASFPENRQRVTFAENRIPGLDCLEEYESTAEWLQYVSEMSGKITWYRTVRLSDGKTVGTAVLRHALEYDDDDPEFCSHVGYSVRPDERRKGYAKAQLRLVLREAEKLGLKTLRLVCADFNTGSRKTIEGCGGVLADILHGAESGMNVLRFDIRTDV